MSSFVSHFYFSMRGRTSRRLYWLFGFIPLVAGGFLSGIGLGIARTYVAPLAFLLAAVVLLFLMVWVSIALHAKRLHDIGLSGWWLIAVALASLAIAYFLSPPVGQLSSLAMWVVIGAVPGAAGANRFGPDPTRLQSQEFEQSDVPSA